MGIFLGLVLGLGLFLVVTSGRPARVRARRPLLAGVRGLLRDAGVPNLGPVQFVAISVGAGLVVGVLVLTVSATLSLAVAFTVFAGFEPRALLASRAKRLREERRELWPHVVDDLASAVRAGLSLPEALAALAERGPESLRPAFARFNALTCWPFRRPSFSTRYVSRSAASVHVTWTIKGSSAGNCRSRRT